MVPDPGILSPQAFVDELFCDRFPNEYLGDTNLRLAVDVSQMVGIRFGETVKSYVAKYGDASRLTAIPLALPDGFGICWVWTMRDTLTSWRLIP